MDGHPKCLSKHGKVGLSETEGDGGVGWGFHGLGRNLCERLMLVYEAPTRCWSGPVGSGGTLSVLILHPITPDLHKSSEISARHTVSSNSAPHHPRFAQNLLKYELNNRWNCN
jgi:hypothetical protein